MTIQWFILGGFGAVIVFLAVLVQLRVKVKSLGLKNETLKSEIIQGLGGGSRPWFLEPNYRSLFEHSRDGILLTTYEGTILDANPFAVHFFGYSSDEFKKMTIEAWSVDTDACREFLSVMARDGSVHDFELQLPRRDGQVTDCLLTANVWRNGGGAKEGLQILIRDVTSKKQDEKGSSPTFIKSRAKPLDEEWTTRDQPGFGPAPFRLMVEHVEDVIFALDLNLKYTYVSPSVKLLRGYEPGELLGRGLEQTLFPDSLNLAKKTMEKTLKRGYPEGSESERAETLVLEVKRKDGSAVWTEVKTTLMRDHNGIPIGVVGVTRDVSSHKKAEDDLKNAHHSLNQFMEFLPDPTFVIDHQSRVTAWNRAMVEVTGVPAESIIGKTDYEHALPFYGDRRPILADLALTWDDQYLDQYISVKRMDDGVLISESYHPELKGGIYLSGTARVLRDAEGRPIGAIESLRNITEVKLAEKAMRESERRWAQIIDFLPDATMVIDNHGTLIAWNQAMETLTGVKASSMVGKGNFEYALPFYGTRRPVMIDLVTRFDQDVSSQYVFIRQQGDRLVSETFMPDFCGQGPTWLWNVAAPLFDEGGRVAGAIESIRDITEHKRAEKTLKESEEKFFKAFRSNPGAISISRLEDGRFVEINQGFTTMYGYGREETIGRTAMELNIWNEWPETVEQRRSILLKEKVLRDFEFPFQRKNREIGTGLNSAEVIDLDGSPHILSISIDITDRKQAAEALRESEEKYRTILESTALSMTISEIESGKFLEVNKGFLELFGFEKGEVIGRTINEFGLFADPADRKIIGGMLRDHGECVGLAVKFARKDGAILDTILSARLIRYAGVSCVASLVQDVTMLRKAEQAQARLQAQLQQAQKMEAVGTLAGGIAHDFNNILSAVFGYTELAIHSLEDRAKLKRYLAAIFNAAKRAQDLVNHILTFSRKADLDRKLMIPKYVIIEALKLLRASLPATIEIQEKLNSSASIMGDSTQIHQIAMNLCTNAWYAMKDHGGLLEVRLDEIEVHEDFCMQHPGTEPGRFLEFSVSDSGKGIPPDVLERIFDPFFTTKPPGEGTGLGLSAVHGIAKSLKGAVTVSSEMGKGTAFSVFLPVVHGEMKQVEEEWQKEFPGGSERILLVDDEAAIIQSGKALLEGLGYEVVTFSQSHEAWETFSQNSDSFDVVVSDYTMPRMTGIDLAKKIRKINVDIPIIICSGYISFQEKFAELGPIEFLKKPYTTHDLAKVLRQVLDFPRETP